MALSFGATPPHTFAQIRLTAVSLSALSGAAAPRLMLRPCPDADAGMASIAPRVRRLERTVMRAIVYIVSSERNDRRVASADYRTDLIGALSWPSGRRSL